MCCRAIAGDHEFRRQRKGRTDIKQIAGYAQDSLTLGPWNVTLGLRAENYSGLSQAASVPTGQVAGFEP